MTPDAIRRFLIAAFKVRLGEVGKCVVGPSDRGRIRNVLIRKVCREKPNALDGRSRIDTPTFRLYHVHSAENSRFDNGPVCCSNDSLFYVSTIRLIDFLRFGVPTDQRGPPTMHRRQ